MRLEPIRDSRDSRAFRGVNIMTPVVVGRYRGVLDGAWVYVELAHENPPYFSQTVNQDPNGGPLWGVTIKRPDGSALDPNPSFCCYGEDEARKRLEEL